MTIISGLMAVAPATAGLIGDFTREIMDRVLAGCVECGRPASVIEWVDGGTVSGGPDLGPASITYEVEFRVLCDTHGPV